MKRNSQMIVLLDVMFIFLFALILKPEKETLTVEIDNYLNIPYTLIFAKKLDTNHTLVYDNNKWRKQKISDILMLKGSAVHPELREVYSKLPKPFKKDKFEIKTYVYGELYTNITKEVFTKCRVNQECQNNIEIYIKKDGSIEVK
ncbi:MAG: Unknown protein [uncultured Sulfurovum sp.]|uniref:Uncharacterized protein n=1 Tax=uncultured Sulfurovum sp. TaxID=269237 RepID=A0A6S6S9F5_9BACT|nr:MAG: Unknown protein [uncultured Sulfurovum sp.]